MERFSHERPEADEPFGLGWHGKRAARAAALTAPTTALRPMPEDSVDGATTHNLLIEGDNLEALKHLREAYAQKVRLIYIDPPYNTGNPFAYPDSFADGAAGYLRRTGQVGAETEVAGRFHTNWLNMIYPRLLLARELLRDDGAIFISIDDHEVHTLRLVCDELFGPENFVATIIWQKVYAPKSTARHFSEDHDYIVVYAKRAASWRPHLLPRTAKQDAYYTNPDGDPRGPWRTDGLSARNYYSKGTYAITTPGGRHIAGPPSGRYWTVSEERFRALDADRRIHWGADGNNQPGLKRFLSEVRNGRVPQTLWTFEEVGHTQEAKKELLELVPFASSDSVFDTPKPLRLLGRVLRLATNPTGGDIVLDFFAGSGTTGHAVLAANAADGGDRRFILVQLPEPTGAPDYPTLSALTRERLRRAGDRIRATHTGAPVDLGFRAIRLEAAESSEGGLL